MDESTRSRLIREHLDAIKGLEAEPQEGSQQSWPPSGYYLLWHLVVGAVLGGLGALVSLFGNLVGAPLFGRRPFELIRVYLTFPMGARALEADEGVVLFIGCLLYLVTGALYGIVIHVVLTTYFADAPPKRTFLVATGMGLAFWIINFYLILSWLQPMLLGGNWIVRLVPIWVAALTHLTFAWVVWAGQRWGRFEPRRHGATS